MRNLQKRNCKIKLLLQYKKCQSEIHCLNFSKKNENNFGELVIQGIALLYNIVQYDTLCNQKMKRTKCICNIISTMELGHKKMNTNTSYI